jgi:hypothetical protein
MGSTRVPTVQLFSLTGKTAIVTGASGGLGSEMTLALVCEIEKQLLSQTGLCLVIVNFMFHQKLTIELSRRKQARTLFLFSNRTTHQDHYSKSLFLKLVERSRYSNVIYVTASPSEQQSMKFGRRVWFQTSF